VSDKAAGKAKEAWGALTGDEQKKEEGRAQQRKAEAEERAEQQARTRQAKKEAREAERKAGKGGLLDDTVGKIL
jgi:uncharacterized protein YjbJ (UPF0337 family)